MKRRHFLGLIALGPISSWAMGLWNSLQPAKVLSMIKHSSPIDLHWPTQEPFLFCAHHLDRYPAGNSNLGIDKKHFAGRHMGSDFEEKDGFRLYHGAEIPGFPVHPHRGFETITIVRRGYADHADSLGAAGRYGEGDVQWMTAGAGVQHSEMFPLLHKDKENTLELFQIWINLPKKNKMVPADFKMLWSNKIPRIIKNKVEISIISGEYEDVKFFEAPKNSWAADPANQVNLMIVKMQNDGEFSYPAKVGVQRSLYFFNGSGASLNGQAIQGKRALFVDPSVALKVKASNDCEFMIMEAKPIGEPVVQHGPFVMNTREEIMQTIRDYQQSEFGGWKWSRHDMIHGDKIERFAKYPDGRVEKPS